MSTKPNVVFVLTSQDKIDAINKPTGWYLPEFAHPYHELAQHVNITVASPKGGEAPLDPGSVEAFKDDDVCSSFVKEHKSLWKQTVKLNDLLGRADEFDAIFVVGGHGPMFDLVSLPVSHDLLREFWIKGKVVSAVCHGPAALLHVTTAEGAPLIEGHAVTGFSNVEEGQLGFVDAMPFSLEDELDRVSGGRFQKAAQPFGECVIVAANGKLITGQNPASAYGIGKAILEAVKQ